MQTIVFLVDNSASMNQKCYMGTTLLDVAKSAVETFVKQRCNRTDKYMLVTLDEGNTGIKSGWKECQNHTFTLNRLKNIVADGVTTLGHALKLSFDLLSINRHLTGIDTYGHGRSPFYLEPSIVIALTDGGKLSNRSAVFDELHLPMTNLLPGSELTKEPFRWDQRLFSLVLRLPASATQEPEQLGSVPTDRSPISLMCEVTGGRSYCIKTQKTLLQCLDSLVQKVQSGVVVHFDKSELSKDELTKFGLKGSLGITESLDAKTNEPLSWHSLHRMIYVRPSPKSGTPIGHWPLPESYFPDQNAPTLPPRSAHPTLRFVCENREPLLLTNFPYDKYELEPSPLTQVLLEQKNAHICWQVYVDNCGKHSNTFHPCGYLKSSSSLTSVNLFVMPYNYPILLPLIDQLIKQKMKPSPEWRRSFEDYLKVVPHYYINPLRKALKQIGAHNLIPESYGTGLSYSVNVYLKKLKEQTKVAADRFNMAATDVAKPRPGVLLKPRSNSFSIAAHCNFQKMLSDMAESGNACRRIEVDEFSGFRLGEHVSQKILPRDFHNPFDIPRHRLLQQIRSMKMNFKQIVQTSFNASSGSALEQLANTLRIRLQDRAEVHNQPISQMGNYQEYVKNMPVPLREANPDVPRRQHTFGNPFKLAKEKGMMVDETEGYDGPSASGPSSKRKNSVDHSGPPHKRKRPSSPHPRYNAEVKVNLKDKKNLKVESNNKSKSESVPKAVDGQKNNAVSAAVADGDGVVVKDQVPEGVQEFASEVEISKDKGKEIIDLKQCVPLDVSLDNNEHENESVNEKVVKEIMKLIRTPGKHAEATHKLLTQLTGSCKLKHGIIEQLTNEANRFKRKLILTIFGEVSSKMKV